VILNASGGIWNGSSFGTPSTGSWSSYAVSLSEQSGTGLYYGTFPYDAAHVVPGLYNVFVYLRAGGSAASTDALLASGTMNWDGLAETDARLPKLLAYADGPFTYDVSTGAVPFQGPNGNTSYTATLTKNITSRAISRG
jgi:hypothetical protein